MKAFLLMLEKGSLLKIAKDRLVYILFLWQKHSYTAIVSVSINRGPQVTFTYN